MHDSYFSSTEVDKYEASEDRILSGKALVTAPGQSPYPLDLEYSYSGAGKLERIVLIREDGSKYTSFSARSKVGMKELAAKLAERIATRTVEALKRGDFVAPLGCRIVIPVRDQLRALHHSGHGR